MIDTKARELLAAHSSAAYVVSSDLARCDRPYGTRKDRFYMGVARRIAKLIGHEVGVTGADRYPGP